MNYAADNILSRSHLSIFTNYLIFTNYSITSQKFAEIYDYRL